MWSGNEECNEDGQPVRLYQPIQYGRSNVRSDDPTASFIGGPASTKRQCPVCKQALATLVQLQIPATDRSLRVEACNSSSCFRSLFESSKFHHGGNGVVVCKRLVAEESPTLPPESLKEKKAKANPKPVDDWGVSGDDDAGLDDLEAKLAAMETKGPKESFLKETTSRPSTRQINKQQSLLPIMALHSMQEPAARNTSDDPRDVGLHGTSNKKIEEMLARYLEDEEDQDIVQMLKGSSTGAAGGQETDQDLTEEEMALLRFSDRIKRAPRQVVRYAYGGEPLWSIPPPFEIRTSEKNRGKPRVDYGEFQIPTCGCGAPRAFECQILPSVLHVLNVDKYVKHSSTTSNQLNDWYSGGGMDFGSIAVYTCSNPSDCTSSDEFVVIQDTAEGQPKAPPAGFRDAGDVVVDENTADFDQDNDEDME